MTDPLAALDASVRSVIVTDRLAVLDARVRSVIAWFGVAAMLIAAAFYLGPPRLLLLPALVPLLASRPSLRDGGIVRGCLLVLAVVIAGLFTLLVSFGGVPHVSTASRSPDGTVVAVYTRRPSDRA